MANAALGDLNGYEKGVVARALINNLIKQGRLERTPGDGAPGEIVFSVHQCHLELLARFCEDGRSVETEREISLDQFRQIF